MTFTIRINGNIVQKDENNIRDMLITHVIRDIEGNTINAVTEMDTTQFYIATKTAIGN